MFDRPDLAESQLKGSVFPAPTVLHRAWGELEKNISYTHSRETWGSDVSGRDFVHSPFLLLNWSHTLSHLFTPRWCQNSSPQGSVLPAVCCVPLAVTALCLLNTLGRWPISQNPHDWKTFYLDTIPCYQQPKETGLKDTLPDNTWRSSAMLSTCPHPPQSNHWPPSNALGLGFSCLAQRTSSCLTVTAGCAVWVFHLPWSKILAQTSQYTDEEVT